MSVIDATSLLPGTNVKVQGEGDDALQLEGIVVAEIASTQGTLVILDTGSGHVFVPRGELVPLLAAQDDDDRPAQIGDDDDDDRADDRYDDDIRPTTADSGVRSPVNQPAPKV